MAKYQTQAMLDLEKRKAKRKEKANELGVSFWKGAWRRLKRNKSAVIGMVVIILLLLCAIFAPLICRYDYSTSNVLEMNQFPSAQHLFGTDNLGRDIFSRCLYGCRVSIPIGLVSGAVSIFLGGFVGLVCAYFAGTVDLILMRVMDIFQAIPGLLMSITIVATLGTGTVPLLFAIGVSCVPLFAKTVRSAVLTVRNDDSIEAARSLGASNLRLMIRHVIPNCVGYVLIMVVQTISGNIMFVSSLSYIGLGVNPPLPEWGSMLSSAKNLLQSYPYQLIFPGMMIMITVFAFNLFAVGLRDALDPRLK